MNTFNNIKEGKRSEKNVVPAYTSLRRGWMLRHGIIKARMVFGYEMLPSKAPITPCILLLFTDIRSPGYSATSLTYKKGLEETKKQLNGSEEGKNEHKRKT